MEYETLWEELTERVKKDAVYQRCLEKVKRAEEYYIAICETLPPVQRQQLDAYISACEELGDRMTVLAYHLGKNNFRRGERIATPVTSVTGSQ